MIKNILLHIILCTTGITSLLSTFACATEYQKISIKNNNHNIIYKKPLPSLNNSNRQYINNKYITNKKQYQNIQYQTNINNKQQNSNTNCSTHDTDNILIDNDEDDNIIQEITRFLAKKHNYIQDFDTVSCCDLASIYDKLHNEIAYYTEKLNNYYDPKIKELEIANEKMLKKYNNFYNNSWASKLDNINQKLSSIDNYFKYQVESIWQQNMQSKSSNEKMIKDFEDFIIQNNVPIIVSDEDNQLGFNFNNQDSNGKKFKTYINTYRIYYSSWKTMSDEQKKLNENNANTTNNNNNKKTYCIIRDNEKRISHHLNSMKQIKNTIKQSINAYRESQFQLYRYKIEPVLNQLLDKVNNYEVQKSTLNREKQDLLKRLKEKQIKLTKVYNIYLAINEYNSGKKQLTPYSIKSITNVMFDKQLKFSSLLEDYCNIIDIHNLLCNLLTNIKNQMNEKQCNSNQSTANKQYTSTQDNTINKINKFTQVIKELDKKQVNNIAVLYYCLQHILTNKKVNEINIEEDKLCIDMLFNILIDKNNNTNYFDIDCSKSNRLIFLIILAYLHADGSSIGGILHLVKNDLSQFVKMYHTNFHNSDIKEIDEQDVSDAIEKCEKGKYLETFDILMSIVNVLYDVHVSSKKKSK